MRMKWSLAALLLAVTSVVPAAWADGTKTEPVPAPVLAGVDAVPLGADTRLETLPNGLTVLVKVDKRFPMVSTRLLVHAGSAYEKPDEAGLSHLLEHMVFKGTVSRPKGEVARQIEAAGGNLNAFTTTDWTCYINDLPASQWKLGMDVARDMAFNPLLDPTELASEKNVVVEEMKLYQDKPMSELYKYVKSNVFHGTAYESPVIGYEKTVRGVSVDAMRAYMKRLYQPRNMLLAVVGDVDPEAVLAEVRTQFGGYTNTTELPLPGPMNAASLIPSASMTVKSGPWNKVFMAVALPVPGAPDARTPGMDVLAYLLGGDETSLLYKTYKYERQLVDSISVSNATEDRAGMFMIFATMDADKVVPFWTALSADLASLSTVTFTPEQLERARLNIEDGHFRTRESLDDLSTQLAYYQFFLGGEQGEINMLAALRSVDQSQVSALIKDWIVPARMSVTVLAPEATVKAGLEDKLKAATAATMTAGATSEKKAEPLDTVDLKTEVVDLGKGRTVVLIPDRTTPYFSVDLRYSGGELLLTPNHQGLATLVAGVLTRGTTVMDNNKLAEYLSDRAGGMGASVGRSGFTVGLSGQKRFSADLFAVLAETLKTPAFRAEEVDRQKISQLAAIRNTEDSPTGLLGRKLGPFLYPDSVYGYQSLGDMKSVQGYTPADVAGFWAHQKNRPWVLAVSGDFDRETVLNFAKSLPEPVAPKVSLEPPRWTTDHTLTLSMAERKQAHMVLVFKVPPVGSDETPALTLLNAVMRGMGGPLFKRLRDEMGLAYTVNMSTSQDSANGTVTFYIGTDPAKLEQAQAGFTQVLEDVRTNLFTAADLERGYNQYHGGYWRDMQKLSARAGEAAGLLGTERPLDYYPTLMERMKALTPEDLRAVAQKYLDPNTAYTVTVLPE